MQPVPGTIQPIGSLIPTNTNPVGFTEGQQSYGNLPYAGGFGAQNGASGNSQGFGQTYGNAPFNTGSTVSEGDYIKDNIQYYQQKFMEMRAGNKKSSWNWSAFFFNASWCFYRKMYKVGFIFLGAQLILSLFQIRFLNLLVMIPLGIFGNYFYMRYTEEALKKAESVPDLQRCNYLRKKGGTSVVAILILYGAAFCIGILLGMLTEFMSYIY